MALTNKLVFQSVEVYDSTPSLVGVIKGILPDSIQFSPERNDVIIEDGQTITESYTVPIEFRTKNTTYESGSGSAASDSIIDDGTADNGSTISPSQPTAKSSLKFKGLNPTGTDGDSHDIVTGDAYLSGHIDVSNGRREVVITGNIEVITASAGVTSATVAAN
jgi:hypothetical protein